MSAKAIAMNRFGLGAKAGVAAPDDPKKWLSAQIDAYQASPAFMADLPSRADIVGVFKDYQMGKRADKAAGTKPANPKNGKGKNKGNQAEMPASDDMEMSAEERAVMAGLDDPESPTRKSIRNFYVDATQARLKNALVTRQDFPERLVHFWSNHFAVSIDKLPVVALAGNYEFEAIRPNIMGKFSDLLVAAVRHPAMLVYLDQAQSIGPTSQLAAFVANGQKNQRTLGLNENLAREIMELHTLGVRTGYSQTDVTEFARALTGNSVTGFSNAIPKRFINGGSAPGETVFVPIMHEPGKRTIMGKTYGQDGQAQARAVLNDLAVHPATARHIATKLARHFVADDPPASLVQRLEADFLKTGGDLPSLYRTLIQSPEAWQPQSAKFKSPWEWTVSALRGVGAERMVIQAAPAIALQQLGQPIWQPQSPAGYADTNAEWAGGNALMRRVELAERIATRTAETIDARALASQLFPDAVSQPTAEAIARAESPAQGLALLLVSPEFLRR